MDPNMVLDNFAEQDKIIRDLRREVAEASLHLADRDLLIWAFGRGRIFWSELENMWYFHNTDGHTLTGLGDKPDGPDFDHADARGAREIVREAFEHAKAQCFCPKKDDHWWGCLLAPCTQDSARAAIESSKENRTVSR